DLAPGERLVLEVGERRAPPEGQRLVQPRSRCKRSQVTGFLEKTLEVVHVELVDRNAKQIPRGLGQDAVAPERLPQLRDMDLKRGQSRLRRLLTPERVDQPLSRDELVRAEEKRGQQGPRLATAHLDRLTVLDDLERPQETKLHCLDDSATGLRR